MISALRLPFFAIAARPSLLATNQALTLVNVEGKGFRLSAPNNKVDIRNLIKKIPKPDQGTQSLEVDTFGLKDVCELPPPNLLEMEFDGVPFNDLHRLHAVFTKNNTKLHLMDENNKIVIYKSCRTEGFKHCRKATSVAATAAALAMSKAAQYAGIKNIRLTLCGIGPGRTATVQQLAKSNLNFVSISDFSDFSATPRRRPRKIRRV